MKRRRSRPASLVSLVSHPGKTYRQRWPGMVSPVRDRPNCIPFFFYRQQ
jgi:hypothetical protein